MKIKKKSKKPNKEKVLWLKQLGTKIKVLRQNKGISQADLAYSIDMDAQNISRIERGLVNPSAYAIKLISEVLEIPLSELYFSLEK